MRDRLIIFTRYPEPGQAKTRLIPVLGPDGAAQLHRQMTERTVAWARELAKGSPLSIEIHYEGGHESLLREWLGQGIAYCRQGEGDIGVRMGGAFRRAFQAGTGPVILVGTDCPGLTAGVVGTALEACRENDLVLGPTNDGGYCLIGMRREIPRLFSGIPWGTGEVLQKTLAIAEDLRLRVFLLDPLDDVDRPEDLPAWQKAGALPR